MDLKNKNTKKMFKVFNMEGCKLYIISRIETWNKYYEIKKNIASLNFYQMESKKVSIWIRGFKIFGIRTNCLSIWTNLQFQPKSKISFSQKIFLLFNLILRITIKKIISRKN